MVGNIYAVSVYQLLDGRRKIMPAPTTSMLLSMADFLSLPIRIL